MDNNQNKFISVSYQLYTVEDRKKSLVEQTQQGKPFQFISGFGVTLDAFEQQLAGMEPGAKFDFTLTPDQAFGDYDEECVHKLEREKFFVEGKFDSENIYPGAVITLEDNEGKRFMARVTEIDDSDVTLDTNHPLAGETLCFSGVVLENRDASLAEIQHMLQSLSGECGGCGGCADDEEGCGGKHGGCGHCHQ